MSDAEDGGWWTKTFGDSASPPYPQNQQYTVTYLEVTELRNKLVEQDRAISSLQHSLNRLRNAAAYAIMVVAIIAFVGLAILHNQGWTSGIAAFIAIVIVGGVVRDVESG